MEKKSKKINQAPSTPPSTNAPPVTPIKKKRKKSKIALQKLFMDRIVEGVIKTIKEIKEGDELSPVEIDNEMFRLGLHKDKYQFDWDN